MRRVCCWEREEALKIVKDTSKDPGIDSSDTENDLEFIEVSNHIVTKGRLGVYCQLPFPQSSSLFDPQL